MAGEILGNLARHVGRPKREPAVKHMHRKTFSSLWLWLVSAVLGGSAEPPCQQVVHHYRRLNACDLTSPVNAPVQDTRRRTSRRTCNGSLDHYSGFKAEGTRRSRSRPPTGEHYVSGLGTANAEDPTTCREATGRVSLFASAPGVDHGNTLSSARPSPHRLSIVPNTQRCPRNP
jgi:hypothetical protein